MSPLVGIYHSGEGYADSEQRAAPVAPVPDGGFSIDIEKGADGILANLDFAVETGK